MPCAAGPGCWAPTSPRTTPLARDLARGAWAAVPSAADTDLAGRALVDPVAVATAARADSLASPASHLGDAGRLAVLAHVLDYDDLPLPSTSHVSAVCVPAALATGGGAR